MIGLRNKKIFFYRKVVCLGLCECFGAGMKQLMMQSRGSQQSNPYAMMGRGNGYGGGTINLSGTTVGSGANARSYKNFYTQAYDDNGFPRISSASPQAMASLASMSMGGGYSGYSGNYTPFLLNPLLIRVILIFQFLGLSALGRRR